MQQLTSLHLGRIKYINVLPVYHALDQEIIAHNFTMVTGTPAELNSLMAADQLDLSAASSIEYARNQDKYILLPDLAIGSRGPVQSVLLLSQDHPARLQGQRILLSSQTHTSATLLKILMQAKFGIEPEYETGDVWQRLKGKQPPRAFLAIGDEALLLREHPDYPHRLDLGGAWLEWTGLPFIFGVWLANKNSCAHKPNTVNAGIKTLLASKTWGQQHLEYIAQLAARKKAFNLDQMQEYFQGLVFDLGPREMEGLQRFFQELHQTGLIEKLPSPETFKGSFCS